MHLKTPPSINKTVIATGLALFAMFFGAGNIVFPLYLGAHAGQNILPTILGFLLSGVGVPILGLIATSLYQGNYQAFFGRLGRVPAFFIITVLMVILGPLIAMPRTETTTFNALLPFLASGLKSNTLFSILYCGIAFFLSYRETKIIHILGFFLSPVKIVSFSCLVLFGLLFTTPPLINSDTPIQAFNHSVSYAYNTMDLIGTFFFCAIAFNSLTQQLKAHPNLNMTKLTLIASLIGGSITSLVYIGFLLVAHYHSDILQGVAVEQTIAVLSSEILGKFGSIFVCVSVSFACMATTVALAQVFTEYLYRTLLKERLPRALCLTGVIFVTYLMSNLDFQGILKISAPLVNILYPALIVLCIFNILHKWKGLQIVRLPVFTMMLIMSASSLFAN